MSAKNSQIYICTKHVIYYIIVLAYLFYAAPTIAI